MDVGKFLFFIIKNLVVAILVIGCQSSGINLGKMRTKHSISFAGYEWQVKHRTERAGPGNNYFSANSENVWVDSQGQLHLKITSRNGKWHCAEIISLSSFGYGTYRFTLAQLKSPLDKNAVIGLFLWNSYASKKHNHEIDIEFSRWGQDENLNAQFVVHPDSAANKHRFNFDLSAGPSTHSFTWAPHSISYNSVSGNYLNDTETNKETWQRTGEVVPRPGREKVRLNLWLYQGQPPAGEQEIEVTVTDFTFEPL